MAATAISLHLRPNRHRVSPNPNFINFFSSSSSSHDTPPPPPQPQSQSQSQSSHSSYFNGLKASLKQSPPPQQQQPHRPFPPSFTNASSSKGASLEELRKNLSELRSRTAAPPPNSSGQQPLSFQELYKRNVPRKDDLNAPGKPGLSPIISIKQSLKQTNSSSQDQGEGPRTLIDRLKKSFNRLPSSENSGRFIEYPSHLGSQMGDEKPMSDSMNIGFVTTYNYKEMGAKLRTLRPEVKGKNWFSLTELNERLKKLREIEDKEAKSRSKTGYVIKDLKDALVSVQKGGDKAKESNIHKFDVLGQLGGTPEFMLLPPQEQLVEKYFHPDNMSSGEKLKIELKKVRDEFKMSESDCGSARVVVAQLTTKIKHLSSVLHKKDKHSRKGLQGMVQQRKKLLKYLRRTDWDSYCFVLSKLGLRDNPDYKA